MANSEHLKILEQGKDAWNSWRDKHKRRALRPDLSGADLSGANLRGFGLHDTMFNYAKLSNVNLTYAPYAEFMQTDLSGANLSKAMLQSSRFLGANLSKANLRGADLRLATLADADLRGANLTDCYVNSIAVWDVQLDGAIQSDLIITSDNQPRITIDNLKMAQFIYLLLNNEEIRDVIDTITSKVVLILGRFADKRKKALDATRDELRKRNYTPILFDFEKPANRDLTETVNILAHLARFIIVDLTDPSSAPHEVATIIPHTVVPVQPLLLQEPLMIDEKLMERREYAMFEDLRRRHHWVLPTFRYQDTAELLASLQEQIIAPAEQKARELAQPR